MARQESVRQRFPPLRKLTVYELNRSRNRGVRQTAGSRNAIIVASDNRAAEETIGKSGDLCFAPGRTVVLSIGFLAFEQVTKE